MYLRNLQCVEQTAREDAGSQFIARLDSVTPVMSHFLHMSHTVPLWSEIPLIMSRMAKLTSVPLELLVVGCFCLSVGFICLSSR